MNENMETTPTAEITAEATPTPTDIPTPTPTAIPTEAPTPAPTPLPDTESDAEIIVEDTDAPIPTETTEAEETEAETVETETEEQTTAEMETEEQTTEEVSQTVIEFPEQIDANIINEPIAIEQIQPFEIEQTETLTVKEEYTIMDKPLTEYTPTEGLLLLILFVLLFRMIFDYVRRCI